ncbi:hypothetical protein [Arthrobacter sp. YC-RL1]|uniref:hypothetical protein n=1 Tax=Arthrobacter sp. YC-RL1 TaxID=1652545 RepID=UPI0009E4B5B5|nr:hypothetical protein [Arthrobacter sp. YC-RL1]
MKNPLGRPYGTMKEPASLGWKPERANKERFAELAKQAGMSAASFFDLMVETLEIDERGLPTWVPQEGDKGQLPIDKP